MSDLAIFISFNYHTGELSEYKVPHTDYIQAYVFWLNYSGCYANLRIATPIESSELLLHSWKSKSV